ncbi:MAG: hypothetical protein FWD73_17670 [Polyangiaceae bacterium]|nr:hypothetical protein [Polyangiaceae bacterium]
MKNYSITRLLVAIGCVASCGGSFGDAPGSSDGGSGSSGGGSDQTNGGTSSDGGVTHLDGGVVDPGTTFSFVQADGPVYVRQGQTITITIDITRYITPGTDITINAISGVPDNVTVDPLIISSGSNTGHLVVTVDESVPQGPLNVTLQGLAAEATVPASTNLQLFVRGAPAGQAHLKPWKSC